jgi:hypothetical protein
MNPLTEKILEKLRPFKKKRISWFYSDQEYAELLISFGIKED